jgi:hypothetical protein
MQQEARAFARIVNLKLRPETVDLALARFRDVSTPLVRAQSGSLGILGAADRASGNAYAISCWQSLADLERSNANPAVVEALAGYGAWMAGPITVESFDVIADTLPAPAPASGGEWARMTSLVTQPGSEQAALAACWERLERMRAASPACTGTLLLAQHIGQRIIAFELWSARKALAATEAEANYHDQRAWRTGALQEPPAREVLDVFGRY